MAPGSPQRRYRALEGPQAALRRLVAAIRREPGITLPELSAQTGLSVGWIERIIVIGEAFGAVERQHQKDKGGIWVVCVRWKGAA